MNLHLSKLWLPDLRQGAIEHCIIHWTGGANTCSALDKSHYHFIIDGKGVVHRGLFSVKANARPFRGVGYAAHALNFNAGSIGISLCGMGGATESPFRPGRFPITEKQWQIAAEVAAQCCATYDISANTYTGVMQHGEIQKRTGTRQRGKWDCCKLPWQPGWSHDEVERDFRLRVQAALKELSGK